jgi:hypothetical protein
MSASLIASDYQKLLFVFVIDTFDRTTFSVSLLVIPYSCAGMILSRYLHRTCRTVGSDVRGEKGRRLKTFR